jgi:O-antigen ligase
MNTTYTARSAEPTARSRTPRPRSRVLGLIGFALLAALGALCILYTSAAFSILATAAAFAALWWITVRLKRIGLEIWQALLLMALTGYMLLNYGFENIAIHIGGLPIIFSYGLMYACLALALYSCRRSLASALTDPSMLFLFALLLLSVFHLAFDLATYGLWAIRDCTMILDGVFLLLGLLWATTNSLTILIKWLMLLTVLNTFYSFTFPWSAKLMAWSPSSGVFQDVPILGQYHTTDMYLLQGAILCLGLASYVVSGKRWLLMLLVMAQLLGLAITQARASYVALGLFILVLTFIGEKKKSGILVGMLASALIVLVLVTSVGGLQLTGRIGPVNISFLADHLRSITGEKVTPASSVQSRFDWTGEAMEHFRAHPIVGAGFGMPLINYVDEETGAVVRYPHNSNITILARLGVIGFALWLLLHFSLLKRFFSAYAQRKSSDKQVYEMVLWIFLFYITVMVAALVEAPFEFPSSAVPFYFFMGLGMGLVRWRLRVEKTEKSGHHSPEAWQRPGSLDPLAPFATVANKFQ